MLTYRAPKLICAVGSCYPQTREREVSAQLYLLLGLSSPGARLPFTPEAPPYISRHFLCLLSACMPFLFFSLPSLLPPLLPSSPKPFIPTLPSLVLFLLVKQKVGRAGHQSCPCLRVTHLCPLMHLLTSGKFQNEVLGTSRLLVFG